MISGRLPYLWLALVVFAIYAQTLAFDFVHFDDTNLITNNIHFISNPANLGAAFRHDVFYPNDSSAYYRPMQTVSLMFNAFVGGEKPWIYFLTDMILHALAVILVWKLFIRLGMAEQLAFVLSLIFAAHPMLTQAVAWVPGRNDVLFAVFILSAFLSFERFTKTRKWSYYFYHLLLWTLALFTKESGVVLPILCLWYFWKVARIRPINFGMFVGWGMVALVWALLRASAIPKGALPLATAIPKILKNFPAFFMYVGKIFAPINLSALGTFNPLLALVGAGVIVLLVVLLRTSKQARIPLVIFGTAWFALFLIPSFFSDDPSSVPLFYDHRAYVPLVGLLVILSEIDLIKRARRPIVAIGIIIALGFASMAIWHALHFKNRIAFWQHAVASAPALPRSYSGLGSAYLDQKEFTKAEEIYRKGIALNPNEKVLHGNLGLLLLNTKRFAEAEKELFTEIRLDPSNMETRLNLGVVYFRQNRFGEAKNTWEEGLGINPNYLPIHENLAIYYYDIENNKERATYHIDEVLKRGGTIQPELLKAVKQ